jgi:hypothetical protein
VVTWWPRALRAARDRAATAPSDGAAAGHKLSSADVTATDPGSQPRRDLHTDTAMRLLGLLQRMSATWNTTTHAQPDPDMPTAQPRRVPFRGTPVRRACAPTGGHTIGNIVNIGPYRSRPLHPQVRPFLLANGRTRAHTRHPLLVHTIVSAPRYHPTTTDTLGPLERDVYEHARRGVSVAEVSAHTGLALGLVRVILADLAHRNVITIHPATGSAATDRSVTASVLERVLSGLQRL